MVSLNEWKCNKTWSCDNIFPANIIHHYITRTMSFPVIIICLERLLYKLVIACLSTDPFKGAYCEVSMSSTHQETSGPRGSTLQGEHDGESLNQEAAERRSEFHRLGDEGRVSRQHRIGKCVRRGGMRAGRPSRQCAVWGHLDRSHFKQGGRPQEPQEQWRKQRTVFLPHNSTLQRVR